MSKKVPTEETYDKPEWLHMSCVAKCWGKLWRQGKN